MTRIYTLLVMLVFGCGTGEPGRTSNPTPVPEVPMPEQAPEHARGQRTCPSFHGEAFGLTVPGHHRTCEVDADCLSVPLDCSNLRCTGVNRTHKGAYSEPIDCSEYSGWMGNYDCMPRFNFEEPVCVEGCCMSERRADP